MRSLTRAHPRTRPVPTDGQPVAGLADVVKRFDANEVLRGVSLAVHRGETMVIMGGSGSGKTVMLRLIAGLIRPTAGRVHVFGERIDTLSEEQLLPIRRRMGYVFQGAALFDSLTVLENVAYPLREHTSLGEAEIRERVLHFLSLVGLGAEVLGLLPSELSGGMRKRVGIARALAQEPEVLLFDEPTAGLDPTNARMVADLIVQLRGGVCDTAVVVTHDLELARTVADRVAILIDGRFAALGPRDEVLASREPAVQAFLAGEARVTT
ncbi:MAG TPA: ABC transporter ATP-binding protein [Candidatus Binatia bacterium]|nr:ABC transporter ATP-binding protein [Candidatus Binatia bacterium]